MSRLDNKPQIWKLAVDLGLGSTTRPVSEILNHVKQRVRNVAQKFSSATLNDLLTATAEEVRTIFKEIHSNEDLENLQSTYFALGETGFANLHNELDSQGYAITLKRIKPAKWDRTYVSVIDCRGDKAFRAYFSKWHELAHLLTLTQQTRLVFRRTHATSLVDAEEGLMDLIAGEVGFLADFIPSHGFGDISFEMIESVRRQVSPDASYQAASIGIVRALPRPCILLEARLALKKSEERNKAQLRLAIPVHAEPTQSLRAVHTTTNQAARDIGIYLPKNWKVPAKSVIAAVFETGGSARARENLSWWRTSSGTQLPNCPVRVEARRVGDSVIALLVAEEDSDALFAA
ncbi:MAG: hypothetical protein AUI02_07030 [Acidobacteria bacterium 13_2_20CM_2_57_12]|nr:MAG: hypothetical protein AUI02_07030 [Acidobacteria bacterium 13_2_20CM_2_57_12]